MSVIDQYNHELIGFVYCPSSYDFVWNSRTRKIALYKLKEDIPSDEIHFDGKIGDILLGGGSGEAPVVRFSYPEISDFFRNRCTERIDTINDVAKVFWTPTQSYILCEGFTKIGWNPDEKIELWLAREISKFIEYLNGSHDQKVKFNSKVIEKLK